jgi:MOSC domain-containing protein YiiM
MASGRLAGIQVSDGGVPKRPVASARITAGGLEGDRQRDLRYHGGPERAVSLYSLERIEALQRDGHPIAPGTTGENLTVAGIDWGAVRPGAELRVGTALLRVTAYASPCRKIGASLAGRDIGLLSQEVHPGWSRVYARVVRGGEVRTGDEVALAVPDPE